jgi:quinohemoprotein amine dehydrogenase
LSVIFSPRRWRFRIFRPLPGILLSLCLLAVAPTNAQTPPASQAPPSDKSQPPTPVEEGIPVTSALVIEKCGSCHKKDEKGNLSRISWERTNPEGWQQTIKRMVRLNGLSLSPEEARSIVKYLSTNHGLAPEEAKPAMYIAERRMIDESVPHDYVRDACVTCHPHGRAMSWRRSREEWDLLVNMHLGYFPVVEFVSFYRRPPRPGSPPPPPGTDTRHPVDRAIEFIANAFPLHTAEWAAWRASMRLPKLSGRWLVSGAQLGRGQIYGEMLIEPAGAEDEFTTSTTLSYVKDGTRVTRSGRTLIYTGYAWRGRSESKDGAEPKELREVMLVSRDQSQIEGRWFWGGYDEFGMDITLRRAGREITVLGLDRTALRVGTTGEQVRIFGDNFPEDLAVNDFDFGSGLTVKRIVQRDSSQVTVTLDVSKDAILGKRDVAVRRSILAGPFAVYDKVDYLKISPEAGIARLGGTAHPKGFQQFEAIAYNRGPDNKPKTPDDVNLGPVDVEWSVEEFLAVFGDDDKEFVGTLSPVGLFTPADEGPNPKRRFHRNNYGDVWVVATYKPMKGEAASPGKDGSGKDSKPLTARSHLVVTIPLYVRWDQPEVAQ